MMRKIHRVALAALLKPAAPLLTPAFSLASTAWAKAFAAERRFTLTSDGYAGGVAFAMLEPSGSASDDYFTVDIAWIRHGVVAGPADLGDAMTIPELAPWKDKSQDDVLSRPWFRLRVDELWRGSPEAYRGSFRFSTASSRYVEQMFATSRDLSQAEREERAFRLLQACVQEEKSLTDEGAAAEVAPALALALQAMREAALPAFVRASALAVSVS